MLADVRCGSEVDIAGTNTDVRYSPDSGHSPIMGSRGQSPKVRGSPPNDDDVAHRASENSINFWTGTDTTLGDPHAVEILLWPNGVERVCVITLLMTAAT
jgi:hypothetical protein